MNDYFARDASLRPRYRRLRRLSSRIVGSSYDVSRTCNLTCEGCLFFEGQDYLDHPDDRTDADWDAFFAAEAARGVNFCYLAGAEPALRPTRLRLAAQHIGRGVVFTNGAVRIDPALPFTIHVSLWGGAEQTARLRGGGNYDKAFRLFGKDPRARFIYTVNAQNLDGAWEVAERCAAEGAILSFSLYSPTEQYRRKLEANTGPDGDYFRISTPADHLGMDEDLLQQVRSTLDQISRRYAGTVLYGRAYNRWVTAPEGLYAIDPKTGWATDCEVRRAPYFRHVRTDLTTGDAKCCSPNIDCRSCRAYSMAAGNAVSRFRRFLGSYEAFCDWIEIAEQWATLFLRDWAFAG